MSERPLFSPRATIATRARTPHRARPRRARADMGDDARGMRERSDFNLSRATRSRPRDARRRGATSAPSRDADARVVRPSRRARAARTTRAIANGPRALDRESTATRDAATATNPRARREFRGRANGTRRRRRRRRGDARRRRATREDARDGARTREERYARGRDGATRRRRRAGTRAMRAFPPFDAMRFFEWDAGDRR